MAGRYSTVLRPAALGASPVREPETQDKDAVAGRKYAPLDFAIATRFADHPDRLFQSVERLSWEGSEEADGRRWRLLRLHSKTATGQLPVSAKIWLDEIAGTVWKVQATIDKPPLPGVKAIDYTVTFNTDGGRCLPATVFVTYPVALFFHSGQVAFTHQLGDWRRP